MTREYRFSRPVYEALPWLYILGGFAALAGSYFQPSRGMSYALGIPGLIVLLAGVVVVLRRRDYRQLKAKNYLNPDAPILHGKDGH
ncbi:MAG: hypothetical protein IRZ28_08440 [Steroidobacteraceae bacterium]|nr:hypothetical protein [Steroidobacteraceae bacterium]